MDNFVLLCPPERGAIRAEWTDGKNAVERIVCPSNPEHNRGGMRLGELDVRLTRRPKPSSVVWTWYGELLATSEVVELLNFHGLTGFEARPVTARFRGGEVSRDCLHELVITGWGGLPAVGADVRRLDHCANCGLSVYSCFRNGACLIDPLQWAGSDFFFVWPAPRFIFITRRVAEVMKISRMTGWSIQELSEVSCISQLTPGPLHQWLPANRLVELRRSLPPIANEFLE
jgi:hypothetical protein